MSTLKYLVILAVILLLVAALAWGVVSWVGIPAITSVHIALIFIGFWLLGLLSVGVMKAMGVDTPAQLVRFIMISKAMRIMISLLGLVVLTLFQEGNTIVPFAILVFVGYITSLLVESWYYLKAN